MNSKKINVTVQYLGNEDYKDVVSSETVFQSIKMKAVHNFELDPASSDKYTLQYIGSDISDHAHVDTLGESDIILTLTLKEEVPKG